MDRLVLRCIRAEGRHGALDGERDSAQPFEVDISLELDLSRPALSDSLRHTVDYAEIAAVAAGIVERESFDLIEALASRIADAVLDYERVHAVEVEVRKLRPKMDVSIGYAAAIIRRSRG